MKEKASPIKSLQVIHTAMLAGMVLFCMISAVIKLSGNKPVDPVLNKTLQVVVLVVSFVLIRTAFYLFNKQLRALEPSFSPAEKFSVYRSASIIKWALIEGPVLFAAICFMLTRNYAFIALAFALVILFALQAPAKLKAMLQLQLSEQEFASLE
jgi:hypothetical protein